jgi:hypothetical protein
MKIKTTFIRNKLNMIYIIKKNNAIVVVVVKRESLPNFVSSSEANPTRDGSVLPHLLGEFLLDYECLV